MAKKTNPMGETLGVSDTLEGIAKTVLAYYGEKRELIKNGDHWLLKAPAGNVMKTTYVYEKYDSFYFASKP